MFYLIKFNYFWIDMVKYIQKCVSFRFACFLLKGRSTVSWRCFIDCNPKKLYTPLLFTHEISWNKCPFLVFRFCFLLQFISIFIFCGDGFVISLAVAVVAAVVVNSKCSFIALTAGVNVAAADLSLIVFFSGGNVYDMMQPHNPIRLLLSAIYRMNIKSLLWNWTIALLQ